jgi:hypothetical protein
MVKVQEVDQFGTGAQTISSSIAFLTVDQAKATKVGKDSRKVMA